MQETLTTAVRLRTSRQRVPDAATFRAEVTRLLAAAEEEGRAAGYAGQDLRLAIYAVVVFLDECVLNSSQPALGEWARCPLQEELFGEHVGGEVFFRYLQQLLARPDSEDLADLLEVFELCLLVGFRGRYGASAGELGALTQRVADRIVRIRGPAGELSPAWRAAGGIPAPRGDPWARGLGAGAAGLAVVACAAFAAYSLALRAGLDELRALGSTIIR